MRKNYVKLTASMLTCVLTIGTVTTPATTTAGVTSYTSNIVTSSTMPTAGATQLFAEMLTADVETVVEDNEAPTVKSEYSDIAIAKVTDYVYVRSEASADSDYVGKLYTDNAATVLETLDGWYKIKSGNVTGYVSSDFVVVGDEEAAKNASRRVALVTVETLRVREKASTEASILTLVPEGDDLTVLDESKEGWVKVSTSEGKGFVSNECVSVSTEYTYAESKEEEEARLAREEAERQAAAEAAAAAAAAENNNNGGSSNGGSNGGGSNGGGSNGGGSNDGGKEYKKPSGANGQAVANYACQFVGNPYVYGGSSLTNGADCSGFVMAVYAKFGVSLPHSSSAQRGCGYGVSKSDMQPGDIICYSGHVAIYIGNGAIVHASNKKDGIKISYNVNYRNVLAVRRIF